MKLVPEPLLKRFKVEKEKKWRSDLVNAGQGGHDARHVDTVGDGNTGSSADAASNRDDHWPAAQNGRTDTQATGTPSTTCQQTVVTATVNRGGYRRSPGPTLAPGLSAVAASHPEDHRPAAQSDPPESPTEGPWK